MSSVSFSKFSSVARPYAEAAFESAHNRKELPEWKAFFASASLVAENEFVKLALNNPETSRLKLFDLFKGVLQSQLTKEQTNFLRLLADNDRLNIIPDIAHRFNDLYQALEKMSNVHVTTAVDIDESFRQKLIQALTKRINHEVTLHCTVDPSIIGGAVLRIGDRVIDGSIREQLAKILDFLKGN